MSRVSLLVLCLSLCGCTYTDKKGVRHSVILGIGVVSSVSTNNVQVTKSAVIGAGFVPHKQFILGVGSSLSAVVSTNNPAIVDVESRSGKTTIRIR